jgi:hypothetical protein
MHPTGTGDYSPYYSPYPTPAAAAPPPAAYPSVSAAASAPPYSSYPAVDHAPTASYPAYPPVDVPHYAPPAAPPLPQPYYPYELPPLPHNPVPSPYPSLDRAGSYGYGSGAGSGYGNELYPPKPAGGGWSDDGVYAYDGGDAPEPYGSRGTAPRPGSGSGSALFDDYGRSIGSATERGGGGRGGASAASPKVARAVPKVETTEDVRGGVQKFRVKLLPEGAGSPMDVLCQVERLLQGCCTKG